MRKVKFTDLANWPRPYKSANNTDITATWTAARKKLEEEKKEREKNRAELQTKLTALRRA